MCQCVCKIKIAAESCYIDLSYLKKKKKKKKKKENKACLLLHMVTDNHLGKFQLL